MAVETGVAGAAKSMGAVLALVLIIHGGSETGITWNNAPENIVESGNTLGSGMTMLGEFSINGNGTPGTIVSCSDPRIADFLRAGDGIVTIAIARDTQVDVAGHVHHFHSRESARHRTPSRDLRSRRGGGG